MNNKLTKYAEPDADRGPYQFPTQLPQRNGLTPYQKEQREIEFVNNVAFQRRRIVTIAVVALVVATLVANIVARGINLTAAFATLCAVGVAYAVRNYSIPKP